MKSNRNSMKRNLEKVRSSKQINIARLNTRKRSENIDLKAAQRIIDDVNLNRPGTNHVKRHCNLINFLFKIDTNQNKNEVATEKEKSNNQLIGGNLLLRLI